MIIYNKRILHRADHSRVKIVGTAALHPGLNGLALRMAASISLEMKRLKYDCVTTPYTKVDLRGHETLQMPFGTTAWRGVPTRGRTND